MVWYRNSKGQADWLNTLTNTRFQIQKPADHSNLNGPFNRAALGVQRSAKMTKYLSDTWKKLVALNLPLDTTPALSADS
jgi:hypothetical protein